MHKKVEHSSFTNKASWTRHVQLHALSSSVNKTDFGTILLIFMPIYSLKNSNRSLVWLSRLLIRILNILINNTRIERIKCDKSLKSQELLRAIASLISYWTNSIEVIIVRIYLLFLLFVTWNILLRLHKLCNSVSHRLLHLKLEKILAGLGLKAEDLSLLILTN